MKFTSDKVKKNFVEDMAQVDQTARLQSDSMMIDVIRKTGKRTENNNTKALMSLGITDDINQCNIYVDAPEVQNMTSEDFEALEESWNTIQMLSKEEKNCEHYVDDLLPNREKTIAELEKQQDLTYEKIVHPEKNVRPNSVAKFLANKDKLESSCHPYELCLVVFRKNELCFFDFYAEVPMLS